MKMPFGKYKSVDLAFINSGYLNWLIGQDWFVMKSDESLVLAVETELGQREFSGSHFYDDKVNV